MSWPLEHIYKKIIENKVENNKGYYLVKSKSTNYLINLNNSTDYGIYSQRILHSMKGVVEIEIKENYAATKYKSIRERIIMDIIYGRKSITKLQGKYGVIYGEKCINIWNMDRDNLLMYSPKNNLFSNIIYVNWGKILLPLTLENGALGSSITCVKGKLLIAIVEPEYINKVSLIIRNSCEKEYRKCPFILNHFRFFVLDTKYPQYINSITVLEGEEIHIPPGSAFQIGLFKDTIIHKSVWYPHLNKLPLEYTYFDSLYTQMIFFYECLAQTVCPNCSLYGINSESLLKNKNDLTNLNYGEPSKTLNSSLLCMVACVQWHDKMIKNMVNEALQTDNIWVKGDDIFDPILLWIELIQKYISLNELMRYDNELKVKHLEEQRKKEVEKKEIISKENEENKKNEKMDEDRQENPGKNIEEIKQDTKEMNSSNSPSNEENIPNTSDESGKPESEQSKD